MRRRRKTQSTPANTPQFQLTNQGAGLGILGILIIIGLVEYMSPNNREIRALKATTKVADLHLQAEAKIANQRYRSACIMPHRYIGYQPNWYPKATVIAENKPVRTGATQTAVVEGTTVCDDRGNTAIIRNGVPSESAKSDDAFLINQRFEDALGWHEKAQRSDVYVGIQ